MTDLDAKKRIFQHQQVERARAGSIVTRRQLVAAAELALRSHGDPGLAYVADLLVGALRGEPLTLTARGKGLPGRNHLAIAAAYTILIAHGASPSDARIQAAAAMSCDIRTVYRALKSYPGMLCKEDDGSPTPALALDVLQLMLGSDEARQRVAKFCQ